MGEQHWAIIASLFGMVTGISAAAGTFWVMRYRVDRLEGDFAACMAELRENTRALNALTTRIAQMSEQENDLDDHETRIRTLEQRCFGASRPA